MVSPGLVPAGVWSLSRSHGVQLAVRRKEAWDMQDSQAYNLQTEREQRQNQSLKAPGIAPGQSGCPGTQLPAENRIPNSTLGMAEGQVCGHGELFQVPMGL